MVGDAMVPLLAVGSTLEAGLRIRIDDAEEVEASTRPFMRLHDAESARWPPGPIYDLVGEVLPHPWHGWVIIDSGKFLAAAHESPSLPVGAMLRVQSQLSVDPMAWESDPPNQFVDGRRMWKVKELVVRQAPEHDRRPGSHPDLVLRHIEQMHLSNDIFLDDLTPRSWCDYLLDVEPQ